MIEKGTFPQNMEHFPFTNNGEARDFKLENATVSKFQSERPTGQSRGHTYRRLTNVWANFLLDKPPYGYISTTNIFRNYGIMESTHNLTRFWPWKRIIDLFGILSPEKRWSDPNWWPTGTLRSRKTTHMTGSNQRGRHMWWQRRKAATPKSTPSFNNFPCPVALCSHVLSRGPVHTYPNIFESANFSLPIRKFPRPHVSVFKSNWPLHTLPGTLSVRQMIQMAHRVSSQS